MIREFSDKIEYRNEAGQLHREDGPAVQFFSGGAHWYINGVRHRDDGPSVTYPDGYKAWHKNGLIHRTDGPAIEHPHGIPQYWINNEHLTEEEFMLYKFVNKL